MAPGGSVCGLAKLLVAQQQVKRECRGDARHEAQQQRDPAVADALGARYALILGDDELAAGVVAVKDLATGDQRKVAFADVAEALR